MESQFLKKGTPLGSVSTKHIPGNSAQHHVVFCAEFHCLRALSAFTMYYRSAGENETMESFLSQSSSSSSEARSGKFWNATLLFGNDKPNIQDKWKTSGKEKGTEKGYIKGPLSVSLICILKNFRNKYGKM